MIEDDEFIIQGVPPNKPLSNFSMGKIIYNSLSTNQNENAAMIDAATTESISYREILGKSCSLADSLLKMGYTKNDMLAICSENSLEFFIPVLATFFINAIIVPINYKYKLTELERTLNITKPKIIFCSKEVSSKFINLKEKFNHIEKIVIINSDDPIEGSEPMSSLLTSNLFEFDIMDVDPINQIAAIFSSSGTTGLPKGVMITHRNLFTNYMNMSDPRYSLIQNPCLGLLPFFHIFGFLLTLSAIIDNKQVIVIKIFETELFLKSIQTYKISQLVVAPPLIVLLCKSPLVKKYDIYCVKDIVSGAAPLSKETESLLKNRLNIESIRQGYGLTETTLGVIIKTLGVTKLGTLGKVLPYAICKVRDPNTGKSLGPGEVGELCFKGPSIMKGYINNEEATRKSFTSDGWLLTGDLGYYDEDEYFYIVDRLKELIKYKGYQVAPAELESILLTHPGIRDAGVVGLQKEEVGELPIAFVARAINSNLSEMDIQNFVAEKVSPHKKLRGGVIFIDDIPRNPSGKILRKELRQLLMQNGS